MNDSANLNRRREEAREAMETEEHRQKRQTRTQTLAKKRELARAAMESVDQRRRHESKNKIKRNQEAKRKAEEEAKLQALTAQERTKQEAEEAKRKAEEAETKARQRKRSQIDESEELIDKLKVRESKLNPLRTLKLDMARAVKEEGVSISKIATSEEARRRLGKTNQEKPEPGVYRIVALIIILIAISGGAILQWSGYFDFRQLWTRPTDIVTPTTSQTTSLVFADQVKTFDIAGIIDSDELSQRLMTEAKQGDLNRRAIRHLSVVNSVNNKNSIAWSELVQRLGLRLPDLLARTLNETFMIGAYGEASGSNSNSMFIILKPRSYEQAYASMLNWEIDLVSDLAPIFQGSRLTSTQTSGVFKDRLILNIDTRYLSDKDGKTIIFYAFLNKETLLIAQNEETFIEVFNRFTTPGN